MFEKVVFGLFLVASLYFSVLCFIGGLWAAGGICIAAAFVLYGIAGFRGRSKRRRGSSDRRISEAVRNMQKAEKKW